MPYVAKLAAAVPEKLELRVIGRAEGSRIQSAHLTPDGRLATPTIIVLDENNRYVGGWVERPAELQKWYLENKPKVTSGALYEHVNNVVYGRRRAFDDQGNAGHSGPRGGGPRSG